MHSDLIALKRHHPTGDRAMSHITHKGNCHCSRCMTDFLRYLKEKQKEARRTQRGQPMTEREAIGYCDYPCNGPIFGRSRSYLAISRIAYWVWMHMPYWLAHSKVGLAILPRAGDIAFGCTCRDKNDAARGEHRSVNQ